MRNMSETGRTLHIELTVLTTSYPTNIYVQYTEVKGRNQSMQGKNVLARHSLVMVKNGEKATLG